MPSINVLHAPKLGKGRQTWDNIYIDYKWKKKRLNTFVKIRLRFTCFIITIFLFHNRNALYVVHGHFNFFMFLILWVCKPGIKLLQDVLIFQNVITLCYNN